MSKDRKVALITGAAKRIGKTIAEYLHASQFDVLLHYYQSEKEAIALCELLNNKRKNSSALLQADLADLKQIDRMVKNAYKKWNRLDVLINNASCFYKTDLSKVTENEWDDLLNTNLKAPFFLAQKAYPYLKKTKGCIINLADVHGERPMRDYGIYCISKAGLIMQTKILAKEWGPDIRVNAISPGTVMLPTGENTLTPKQKQKIIDRIALKRHGFPEDIAKAMIYLINHADYVTGTVLTVDGGRSLTI